MDKRDLEIYLKMLESENDSDAIMGLRGAQEFFKSFSVKLEDALRYASGHISELKENPEVIIDHVPSDSKKAVETSVPGMPECRVSSSGALEIVRSGQQTGDIYVLPGAAASEVAIIAANLKDAVVAAVINKSRFKLKLIDVRVGDTQIVETVLHAEYERAGMVPIRIWINNRGEVGALAAVLRKAVANTLPDLVAA